MDAADLRLTCMLGAFLALATKDGNLPARALSKRISDLADLAEEFCRVNVPEAFDPPRGDLTSPPDSGYIVQRMTLAIIAVMQKRGDFGPEDLDPKEFTKDEIQQHWQTAKALAHTR